MKTKYVGEQETLRKSPDDLRALIFDIMKSLGCLETISKEVAEHLVNSSLSGVDSHGIWRILQYAEYYQNGYLKKNVLPEIRKGKKNSAIIDGLGGIGIPAMNVALQHSIKETKKSGINVVGVINTGHTGRLGAYTEIASSQNNLCIIIGGILLVIVPGVKKEAKIPAHVAVLLTLIVLLGLIMPLMGALDRGSTVGIIRVAVMIFSTALALVTFIRSFIEVRKKRKLEGN